MTGVEVGVFIAAGTVAAVATVAVAAGTVWALMQIEARVMRANRQRVQR